MSDFSERGKYGDDTFIINDIKLTIPPTAIQVVKEARNLRWDLIRAKEPVQVKTGHASVLITLQVEFVGLQSIEKLRRLAAEISLTPFVYLENDFLRQNLLPNNEGKPNMAGCVKRLIVNTNKGDREHISATIVMDWFNYLPYTSHFNFAKNIPSYIGEPIEPASSLVESAPWQEWVNSNLSKHHMPYSPVRPAVDMQFVWVDWEIERKSQEEIDRQKISSANGPETDHYKLSGFSTEAEKEPTSTQKSEHQIAREKEFEQSLQNIKDYVKQMTSDMPGDVEADLVKRLTEVITKSFKGQFREPQEVQKVLDTGGWKYLQDRYLFLTSASNLALANNIYWKVSVFDLHPTNHYVVMGITFQQEHDYAHLPVIGHQYATIQYLGGQHKGISLSILVDGEDALKRLQEFWDRSQQSALKMRSMTRNAVVRVNNDILNMLGVDYLVPDSIEVDTIEGNPGQYSVRLDFSGAIREDKRHDLRHTESFETEASIAEDFLKRVDKYIDLLHVQRGSYLGSSFWGSGLAGGLASLVNGQNYLVWTWNLKEVYRAKASQDPQTLDPIVSIIAEKILPILQNHDIRMVQEAMQPSALRMVTEGLTAWTAANYQEVLSSATPLTTLAMTAELIIKNANAIQKTSLTGRYLVRQAMACRSNYISEASMAAGIKQPVLQIASSTLSRLSDVQTAKLESMLSEAIRRADDALLLEIRKVLQQFLATHPSFKDLYERAKNVGILKGRTCYPDMALDELDLKFYHKETQFNSIVQPDFYFYNEGKIFWDPVAFDANLEQAKALIRGHYDFLLGTGKDSLSSWVQDVYLKKHLTEEQAADFRSRLTSQFAGISKKLGDKVKDIKWFNSGEKNGIGFSIDGVGKVSSAGPTTKTNNFDRSSGAKEYSINPTSSLTHDFSYIGLTESSNASHTLSNRGLGAEPRVEISHPTQGEGGLTSYFGWRKVKYDPNRKYSTLYLVNRAKKQVLKFHQGIDFGTDRRSENNGSDLSIYAVADGSITKISIRGESLDITIRHPSIGLETIYRHIDFHLEDGVGEGSTVRKGQKLGRIYPFKDYRSRSWQEPPQGHLHFETHIVDRGLLEETLGTAIPEKMTGKEVGENNLVDPLFILHKIVTIPGETPTGFRIGESLLEKSLQSLKDSLYKNNIYRMGRAFPTFKLYFIEEDIFDGGRKVFQFDDFFDYSAVHSIDVYQSADNPIDTAVITLSNIGGNLSNRRFGHDATFAYDETGKVVSEEASKGSKVRDTKGENPISSFMIQEGLKVQLKLGYDSDPNKLTTVLNGTISGVEFNETTDIVTIYIDSYGYELIQSIKGIDKPIEKSSGWLIFHGAETQEILSDLIAEPEVQHFGRWKPGYVPGTRAALTNRWRIWTTPDDDNIFAPRSDDIDGGGGVIFEHLRYFIHKTTIWDVFQEMTLRHPGWIAQAVPYEGIDGPRMTMFFGTPGQQYFSRDLKLHESSELDAKVKLLRQQQKAVGNVADVQTAIHNPESYATYVAEEMKVQRLNEEAVRNDLLYEEGVRIGQIKPFRGYHFASSWNNIIANNIKATPDDVYNMVSIDYDEVEGHDGARDQWEFDDHYHGKGTVEMKAHWSIPEPLCRELKLSKEDTLNCETESLAIRYALATLKKSLGNAYKGELVILGNPDIKSNDIVYICDTYSDMAGPIEVESVTHTLSKNTGFITVIKPRMCVSVNEWASMSISDALGLLLQNTLQDNGNASGILGKGLGAAIEEKGPYTGGAITTGVGIAAGMNPIGAIALGLGAGIGFLGLRKIVQLSQYGNPLTLSPLLFYGKPLTAGIAFKYTKNGFWATMRGRTAKWVEDAERGVSDIWGDFVDGWEDMKLGGGGSLGQNGSPGGGLVGGR